MEEWKAHVVSSSTEKKKKKEELTQTHKPDNFVSLHHRKSTPNKKP